MNATASTSPSTSVSVIGLGNLGQALAGAFLAAGHPTTVWNRSAAKADALVARGAVRAATAAEAVAASDLVVVAVLDQDTARTVLESAAAALPGRTVVNLTTSTPEPARALADWATGHGADYLMGAVYAVPQTIGTDDAFILYSGSAGAHERYRAELNLLGGDTFVGSDPGLAAVHDVAILSGMYGLFSGFFQAVALGRSERIKAVDLTGHLNRWLQGVLAVLPEFAAEIDAESYETEASSLDMNATGLRNILTATESQGLSTELLAPLQRLLDDQVTKGHARHSLSRAVESLKPAVR
ncbi:NAD(P)-dependent oxidoreductase [Streptomyces qinzhouensis]|uniref:NAD(P)-dependent oxidoreductase n=1 Tax=Streptomyces qinzhouensis TaxID=2599401 RepID=A0A5B8J7E0_9ACTN|nr:NAD(P)-binding domain-containing protein [Streptomyces qinzhouensis]QDY77297.1 NAD(P)-dependent oxidoreductase [Streptomyces qinzhouensis]